MIIRSSHRLLRLLRHHRPLLLCGRLLLHRLPRRALVEGARWSSHQLRWNLGTGTYAYRTGPEGSPAHRQSS